MSILRNGIRTSQALAATAVWAGLQRLGKIGADVHRELGAARRRSHGDSADEEHQLEANAPLRPDLAALLVAQAAGHGLAQAVADKQPGTD